MRAAGLGVAIPLFRYSVILLFRIPRFTASPITYLYMQVKVKERETTTTTKRIQVQKNYGDLK